MLDTGACPESCVNGGSMGNSPNSPLSVFRPLPLLVFPEGLAAGS